MDPVRGRLPVLRAPDVTDPEGPPPDPPATAVNAAADTGPGRSRRDRGISVYAQIFGIPEQEVAAAFTERVGPVFAEEALHGAGGAAWSHPGLTDRERSIAVITALTAHGVSGDRLTTHLHLARHHGLDEDALTALMTLLAGYLGYPRTSTTMETIHHLPTTPP